MCCKWGENGHYTKQYSCMDGDIRALSYRAGIRALPKHDFWFSLSSFDSTEVTDFSDSTWERISRWYPASPKFASNVYLNLFKPNFYSNILSFDFLINKVSVWNVDFRHKLFQSNPWNWWYFREGAPGVHVGLADDSMSPSKLLLWLDFFFVDYLWVDLDPNDWVVWVKSKLVELF